jgi:hypothetical protein
MEQQDRFVSADAGPVVVRIKLSVNRIDLRGSGDYLAGNIGNTAESTRVFFLSNVSRQGSGFSSQVIRAEAAHDAVRMADRVFAFDEAVYAVEAVAPPPIRRAVQLLELYYEMGRPRCPKHHTDVGPCDPSDVATRASPELPGFRLKITINSIRSAAIPVLECFAKIVRQLGLVPVE